MADLTTTFIGTAVITIANPNPDIAGPYKQALSLPSVVFSAGHGTLDVGPFPSITTRPFSTPSGDEDVITVTKKDGGTGTFDVGTGDMSVLLTLRFDHSLRIFGVPVPGSDLPLVLTTGSQTSPSGAFTVTGSPLNRATGAVTLVAASAFQGGVPPLSGTDCSVILTGTLSPSPFVTEPEPVRMSTPTPWLELLLLA